MVELNMMNEKRFTYVLGDGFAVDGVYISPHEVVELLNNSYEENQKLNEENDNLKQALWEAEEEYLHEAYHDNPIRLQDKIINLKEEWDKEYWND